MLARLLTPHAFGVVAMSAVVTALAGQVSAFGLGSALIQKTAVSPGQLWWVFRVNLGLSLGLWAGCVAASPWVSRFFHEPLVGPVLAVSAAVLPIGAVGLVPRALLTRQLEFRKLVACEFTGAVATAVTSVTMALIGLGVWSLVGGSLAGAVVSTALVMRLAPWRPSRAERAEGCLSLLRFGAAVAATGIVNYWAYSIANVVIGRVLGAAALGVYTMAFTLAMTPVSHLTALVSSVTLPAFAAIKEDRERLSYAYLRCVRWSVSLALPACAILAALAPQVVEVVLGERWAASVLPFRLLLAAAAARALYIFAGSVLQAVGRPQVELLFQGVFCAGVAGSAALAAPAGVNGVAGAVTGFICCVSGPAFVGVTARAAGTGLAGVMRAAGPPALAAGVAGVAAWSAAQAVMVVWRDVWNGLPLILGACTGALMYTFSMTRAAPDLVVEGRQRVRAMLGRPRPAPARAG